jgi:hypothetical protein
MTVRLRKRAFRPIYCSMKSRDRVTAPMTPRIRRCLSLAVKRRYAAGRLGYADYFFDAGE